MMNAMNQTKADDNLNKFFQWAYRTRGNTVKELYAGKEMTPEKVFLSFMSHNPIFISNGSAGLNGSVKGIGFAPKEEYMQEALEAYKAHIKTFDQEDKTYSHRGLEVLIKYLYSEEAEKHIDFSCCYGVEMAFKNSYTNYKENEQASLVFYQPPVISYELKGRMQLIGESHSKESTIQNEELPLLQQFVNAQHDVYHMPNTQRWKTRPVYKFHIDEIWDKSATPNGFGVRIQ